MPRCGTCGTSFAFHELHNRADGGLCLGCIAKERDALKVLRNYAERHLKLFNDACTEHCGTIERQRVELERVKREAAKYREALECFLSNSRTTDANGSRLVHAWVPVGVADKVKAALAPDAGKEQ